MPIVALLDTKVWVSAFLKPTGPPGRVVSRWLQAEFDVVTSLPQLTELAEVLRRPASPEGLAILSRKSRRSFASS